MPVSRSFTGPFHMARYLNAVAAALALSRHPYTGFIVEMAGTVRCGSFSS